MIASNFFSNASCEGLSSTLRDIYGTHTAIISPSCCTYAPSSCALSVLPAPPEFVPFTGAVGGFPPFSFISVTYEAPTAQRSSTTAITMGAYLRFPSDITFLPFPGAVPWEQAWFSNRFLFIYNKITFDLCERRERNAAKYLVAAAYGLPAFNQYLSRPDNGLG